MCGIIAGIYKNIFPILVNGLQKLEYRGYDSAGLNVIKEGEFACARAVGKFTQLKKQLDGQNFESSIGIGHVRWATHGAPTIMNTHPHSTDSVSVVHNGIIDNYLKLKQFVIDKKYKLTSETDTEIVAKLLDYHYKKYNNPQQASNETIRMLKGSYSIVIMFKEHPDLLIAVKNKTPLVLGIADEGMLLASDAIAFSKYTKKVIYLEDGDKIMLSRDSYKIKNSQGESVDRKIETCLSAEDVSKADYPHFMLKEIHEQPIVFKRVIDEYLNSRRFDNINIDWSNIKRLRIIACGSSYFSGLIGKYWLEEYTNIPVDVEIASEYRYRKSAASDDSASIIISQSGETLDALDALKKLKSQGEKIISIVNVEQSSIARESDYVLPIRAGTEIGVASTKTFSNQLGVLSILSIHIGLKLKYISNQTSDKLKTLLKSVPKHLEEVISNSSDIQKIAKELKGYSSVLFLGRGNLFPLASEGALKLKELSYIHAESYAGGELKHGPISLINKNMPVVALIQSGDLSKKMFSDLQEIMARDGQVVNIVSGSYAELKKSSKWVINLPKVADFIAPIIFVIPMQLLAYYSCNLLAHDADKPRNLAKSVTV